MAISDADREDIKRLAGILGRMTSERKKVTSRENGKKGGRHQKKECITCVYYTYPADKCSFPVRNAAELDYHQCKSNPCEEWERADPVTLNKHRVKRYQREGCVKKNAQKDRTYILSELHIDVRQLPLQSILDLMQNGSLDLTPNSRHSTTWNKKKQSLFVESLLIGFMPQSFCFDIRHGKWDVIDGFKRLAALRDFVLPSDGNKLHLADLEYFPCYENMAYSDLPDEVRQTVQQTSVVCCLICGETPDDIVENLFKRLHS